MLMLASTGGSSGIVSGTCSNFIPMEPASEISEAILVIYQLTIREASPSNFGRPVHFGFVGLGVMTDILHYITLIYVHMYCICICIYIHISIKDHFMKHFTPNNSEQLVKVLVGFVHLEGNSIPHVLG